MPSFFIRGLARYIAASAMERRASRSHSSHSYTPIRIKANNYSELSEADLCSWSTDMRWLIPFVRATGYRIVIEIPSRMNELLLTRIPRNFLGLLSSGCRNITCKNFLNGWHKKKKEICMSESRKKKEKRLAV